MENYFAQNETYDPATGLFGFAGGMTIGRTFHAASVLNNGKVLVTGGLGAAMSQKFHQSLPSQS